MPIPHRSKEFFLSFASLVVVTIILLGWLVAVYSIPASSMLKFALAIPFLFFFPGFFVLKKIRLTFSAPEQIILAVFFSLALNGVALDVVERIRGELSPVTTALTLALVNIASIVVGTLRSRKIK